MEYQDFINEVKKLGFVSDDETAGNMVKAVLGILVSSMHEKQARELADRLPEPLTLETLHLRRTHPHVNTFEDYVSQISEQFKIDTEKSRQVVNTVLNFTGEKTGLNLREMAHFTPGRLRSER